MIGKRMYFLETASIKKAIAMMKINPGVVTNVTLSEIIYFYSLVPKVVANVSRFRKEFSYELRSPNPPTDRLHKNSAAFALILLICSDRRYWIKLSETSRLSPLSQPHT